MFSKDITLTIFDYDAEVNTSLELLYELFSNANKELYLVGGCVRDLLLNKKPKDYDLTTNATPEEVKEIISKVNFKSFNTGIKHGTVTVIDRNNHKQFEITTYRIDGKYDDGRHPNKVSFSTSLEEDLKRRDFTINSFAYHFKEQKLLMLEESFLSDLKYGFIRTVGDPSLRFNEDALRMLRAIRFASELNYTISSETYRSIKENAQNIKNISKERIRDEISKILLSSNPQKLVFIVEAGLEQYLFDGLTPIADMLFTEHQNPWHYTDVFHHTMDVVKAVKPTFELRWAAFLHDVGKKEAKHIKVGTTDHYTYYNHPEISYEKSVKLMNVLKFSNEEKRIISTLVKYHDFPLAECKMNTFKKVLVKIGVENFLDYMELRKADADAHNVIKETRFAIDSIEVIYDRFRKITENKEPLAIKDLAINGSDLIALGIKEGPRIAEILENLLNEVLSKPELNNKEKLISLVKREM